MTEHEPESIYSTEAASILGVTIPTIKKLVREGKLKANVNEIGWWTFDRGEVETLKRGWRPNAMRQSAGKMRSHMAKKNQIPGTASITRGRLAKKCFECFDQGHDVRKTVVATGADPKLVREFWREYNLPLAAGEEQVKREAEEKRALADLQDQRRADRAREKMKALMELEKLKKPPILVQASAEPAPRLPFSRG